MRSALRKSLKFLAGSVLPNNESLIHLCSIPEFKAWTDSFADCQRLNDRYKLYDHVNLTIPQEDPIDFLEFGVFKGESIKYWSELNRHEGSRFFGFDTFTGLPEGWSAGHGHFRPASSFDTGGSPPRIEDPRVTFVPGLFQETLPNFLKGFEPQSNLIIHNDADLYSGSRLVTC